MQEFIKTEYPMQEIIGRVFAKGTIGMVYAESGIGKTTTTINFLNEDGITPILVDFDDNPSPTDMDTTHTVIDGYQLSKHMLQEDARDIDVGTGKVYIVDTYAHSRAAYTTSEGFDAFEPFLELLNAGGSNTVIVIAHAKELATRKDLADVEEVWGNHLGFKVFIKEQLVALPNEPKVKKPAAILVVKKLRGYKGPRDIFIRHLDVTKD